MTYVKPSRGERRFLEFDSGGPRLEILPAILGSVAGSFASAGASTLMGKLFGGRDKVSGDYRQIMQAQAGLAKQQTEYGQRMEQLGLQTQQQMQQIFGGMDQKTKEVISRLEPTAARQMALAQGVSDVPKWVAGQGRELAGQAAKMTGYGEEALARHRGTYQPLEDEAIQDYRDYATGGRMAQEEARASADVAQAYDAQRDNALRQLEGYGIDPGQARHGALSQRFELDRAARQAQAQTEARRAVEATGRQMRQDLLTYGSQYPGWAQQRLQTGMQGREAAGRLGQAATGAAGAVGDVYGGAAQTQHRVADIAQESARTGAGLLTAASPYFNAAQRSFEGASSAYGGAAGAAGGQLRGGRYDPLGQNIGRAVGSGVQQWAEKKWGSNQPTRPGESNKWANIHGSTGMMALGGEVEGPGGPYDDAVPIQASDGEYVIPYEVVHRKGTEFFDKLIDKTRQDLQALPVGG